MSVNLLFLALFLLVNVAGILLFRHLSRHMFRKHQVLMMQTLAHLDHQLAKPHPGFQPGRQRPHLDGRLQLPAQGDAGPDHRRS